MTNRNSLKTLLGIIFLFCCFAGSAQYKVKQVFVANGGPFGFLGNYITIGSYNPVSKKYTLFDSTTGGSVTQVMVDSGYAYMATDSYLVKYDVSTLKRVGIAKCRNLRYIAVYKDKIVATVGYDLTTTHLKIFKKNDLSLVYSENKIPNIYCNGITVIGDSAYIALQGQYPDYNDTGRIAVEDLVNQKFKRVITLDTATKGIGDIFANGNSLVGVSEYPYSTITTINLSTGAKNLTVLGGKGLSSIGLPFALYNDTLYAQYQNDVISGIGGYNLSDKSVNFYVRPNPYYAAAALDTINKLFYYTGGSFSKPTKTWIYNYKNRVIDSFDIGIAPEGIAIDYELNSGINENSFANQKLNLYPNPAMEILNISGIDAKTAEIKLIDVTGRVLFTKITNLKALSTTNIPVSELPKGVYFISIQSVEGVISREFIKN